MDKQTCAFSIPHEDKFAHLYQAVYSPIAIEAGFEPIRVLDFARRADAIGEAWDATKADIAVVDLTNACGQPFYFLALRQFQAKPTILTSQRLDDVPLAFRALPIVEYHLNEPRWDKKLKTELLSTIETVMKNSESAILNPFGVGENTTADEQINKVMGWAENEKPADDVKWKMGFHTFVEEARKRRGDDNAT
ncbi:MAG: hypothetical protein ACI9G1_001182 [Pirellulaceae bacterium]|jgi:hypothetical protein